MPAPDFLQNQNSSTSAASTVGSSPSVNSPQGNSDLGSWSVNSSRNIQFKYEHLDDILTKESFRYTSIPSPDFNKSAVVNAYHGNYNAKNEKNAVIFCVEGRPLDSDKGREVMKKSFIKVKDVLKNNYKPATATIVTDSGKGDGKHTSERYVDHCMLTGVDMVIDQNEGMIVLRFTFQGLLRRDSK